MATGPKALLHVLDADGDDADARGAARRTVGIARLIAEINDADGVGAAHLSRRQAERLSRAGGAADLDPAVAIPFGAEAVGTPSAIVAPLVVIVLVALVVAHLDRVGAQRVVWVDEDGDVIAPLTDDGLAVDAED